LERQLKRRSSYFYLSCNLDLSSYSLNDVRSFKRALTRRDPELLAVFNKLNFFWLALRNAIVFSTFVEVFLSSILRLICLVV